jgi:predicted flap endonuclease-1-like 5' DNA nuclease
VHPDRAAAPAIVSASGDDNEREPQDSEASVGPDGAPLATIAIEHPPVLPASQLAAMNPAPEIPTATRKATEPAISATTPDGPASLEPTLIPQTSPEPLGPRQAVPGPESTTAAPEPVHGEVDEDAAMRAIEGGWSRRDARALPDAPELTDLTAAVSAAQMAVEQVLARNGVAPADGDTREQLAFGRPRGLPHARNGGRDDLKQISGLGPLDESALNNLGIYHFDQVAGWTEREVLWLENHAFARGRIGRERWQAQARALAGGDAVLTARR